MPHLEWTGESVKVTSLGNPESECGGRVASESGDHILVLLAQRLPVDVSVRIDGPGFVVLGDVCSREPTREGYVVYIKVVHVAPNSYLSAAKGA